MLGQTNFSDFGQEAPAANAEIVKINIFIVFEKRLIKLMLKIKFHA